MYNELYNENYKKFIVAGLDEEQAKSSAHELALSTASAFGNVNINLGDRDVSFGKTKINDAQSYITIYELARRRYANGTIDEFGDLIENLLFQKNNLIFLLLI